MTINKLWSLKMLFVWRWRLGYWDWEAFRAAWKHSRPLLLLIALVLGGCRDDAEPVCLRDAELVFENAEAALKHAQKQLDDACKGAYGNYWTYSGWTPDDGPGCANVVYKPLPESAIRCGK